MIGGTVARDGSYEFYSTSTKEDLIFHPGYVGDNIIENDIALVRIKVDPNVFTEKADFVGKISLPSVEDSQNLFEFSPAEIAGFGRYNDSDPTPSNELRYGATRVMPNDKCLSYYRKLVPSQMCIRTAFGFSSTCGGDSGKDFKIL